MEDSIIISNKNESSKLQKNQLVINWSTTMKEQLFQVSIVGNFALVVFSLNERASIEVISITPILLTQ